MDETTVIKIDGWLWRVIAMSWAITELAKKTNVKVITSRPLVFWGNPYIKSVHWLEDRRLYEDVIQWNNYIELEPYTKPAFFNDAENWLKVAADELGLDTVPQPCLFLAEHEKMQCTLQWNNPVLFQPFGSAVQDNIWADKSYRSFYIEDAQYIATKLVENGCTPYLIIRQWQPILEWCQVLDTPDLRWVVSLASKYPVVWCDSSMHHASKAFWKQAVVMRAGTDCERYGYESNINLREHKMVAHTPLRLLMNDFNFDISNQYTNKFSKEFLNKFVEQALNVIYQTWINM